MPLVNILNFKPLEHVFPVEKFMCWDQWMGGGFLCLSSTQAEQLSQPNQSHSNITAK